MISRVWRGWTRPQDADEYERMLRADMLPGIGRVRGYEGAYLLRRDVGDEVEFMVITQFSDMGAVREFAGEDYTVAVIHEPARRLFTRFDERSVHYETVLTASQVRQLATERADS